MKLIKTTQITVNIVGHTHNKIYTLRTWGKMLWVALFFINPLHALEVHDVDYNISIALKIECDVLLSIGQVAFSPRSKHMPS